MPVVTVLVVFAIWAVVVAIVQAHDALLREVEKRAADANKQVALRTKQAQTEVTLKSRKNAFIRECDAYLEALMEADEIRTPLVDPVTCTLTDAREAQAWVDSLIVVCDQGHRHTHGGFKVAMGTQIHTTVRAHTERTQVSGQSQLYHTTPNGWVDRQVGTNDHHSSFERDVYIPETNGNVVERRACPTCGTNLFSFEGELRGYRVCQNHIVHGKLHDKWYGHPLYHVYADRHLQCPVCVLDRRVGDALEMIKKGQTSPMRFQAQRAASTQSAPPEPAP